MNPGLQQSRFNRASYGGVHGGLEGFRVRVKPRQSIFLIPDQNDIVLGRDKSQRTKCNVVPMR
jgi:hypothetical protein